MARSADAPHRVYRFGVFEVDTRSGEVRKRGVRQHLQGKPFQILLALLERPGGGTFRHEDTKSRSPSSHERPASPADPRGARPLNRDPLGR